MAPVGAPLSNLVILGGYLLVLNGVASLSGRHYRKRSLALLAIMALIWLVAGVHALIYFGRAFLLPWWVSVHGPSGATPLADALARADLALYRAKSLGGNRLEAALAPDRAAAD